MQIKQEVLNNIPDHGAKLDIENRVLKFMLTKLQFAILPAAGCCPVCGGNQRHDSACELAALIDPDHALSYKADTGREIIDTLLFDLENPK
jgi:hypothetical protein